MNGYTDWQDVLSHADIRTARLIVQLQMQDAQTLSSNLDTSSLQADADLARRIFEDELKQLQGDFPNRQLGENLEDQENDREEAFEAAAFSWQLKELEGRVEQVPEPVVFLACTACTDRFHPDIIVQVPCSHHYCRGCLEDLYYACMTDESLFPPRCCHQEFPWELVRRYLTSRCRSMFGTKRAELETKDRTYCCIQTCSAFIKPTSIAGTFAPCPRCNHGTCAACKGSWHYGTCPRDQELDVLMYTTDRNGWRQCRTCRRIIELKLGCNHITLVFAVTVNF